ncbi:MAG: phosphomannomutase/phosphoglucomutase [Clostridia bacterium]|nr:phosphomannomutase/phosphoglucomutase [Clostridia bacterium]
MSYLALKSGTDVRGTAMGENANLTAKGVSDIAAAFAYWLSDQGLPLRVAVGHDSRLTGEEFTLAVCNELAKCGCEVFDCGLCSTPSIFMMTKFEQTQCGGGIMITASHHPSDKNGLKFFTPSGGLSSGELTKVLELADDGKRLQGQGKISKGDYLGLYCDFIKNMILKSLPGGLSGYKVVVDAGSGAGGFFADRILAPLGADVSGSQFLEPDGRFPFHQPNPENKAAMASISERVKEVKADFGIIFDTDVDRSAVVTGSGVEINRNRLIALISDILLRENPGAYIVTDSVTSDGLAAFIASRGGNHIRYKRGYRNVIDFAIKLTKEGKCAPLAIETSGHAAFEENFFLDDGAYLAVKLLINAVMLKQEGKEIDSLIADLVQPQEEAEIRIKLSGDDWKAKGQKILADMEEWGKREYTLCQSYEGVRINNEHGFFMARMSVHDPIIPINIECNASGGLKQTASVLYKFLQPYGLDLEGIKQLM